MSDEPKAGFSPSTKPGKLTIAEFQQVAGVVRSLLADEPFIKYSIYAAGIAGLLDSIHWAWLIIGFVYHSLK